MFLLPMGYNPAARHIHCWSDVSGCQQQGDELCWAIVVHTDGGEPVCSTSLLQLQVFFPIWKPLSRWSMRWPHACSELTGSSLPTGRGRPLLQPLVLPSQEPLVDVQQADTCCLSPPLSAGFPPAGTSKGRAWGVGKVPGCMGQQQLSKWKRLISYFCTWEGRKQFWCLAKCPHWFQLWVQDWLNCRAFVASVQLIMSMFSRRLLEM